MHHEENKELKLLKNQIGFGTAFKATLGFYVARLLVTIVGLIGIGVIAAIIMFISK